MSIDRFDQHTSDLDEQLRALRRDQAHVTYRGEQWHALQARIDALTGAKIDYADRVPELRRLDHAVRFRLILAVIATGAAVIVLVALGVLSTWFALAFPVTALLAYGVAASD
jgi:hypothetical protein